MSACAIIRVQQIKEGEEMIKIKTGARFFNNWLHRWLWFTGEITREGYYIFVDAGDEGFALTADEVERMMR